MNDQPQSMPPLPAKSHAHAAIHFRRPFAPGAIGFRPVGPRPYRGQADHGAEILAYINAHSLIQRLNCVVPGCWEMEFQNPHAELLPAEAEGEVQAFSPGTVYLICRLTIALPLTSGGELAKQRYTDVGSVDAGAWAGLKALFSDAKKRAGAAAGIGSYLYTTMPQRVLRIGEGAGEVRRGPKGALALTPQTVRWLRCQYREQMRSRAVLGDLGPILTHGEPDEGIAAPEAEGSRAAPAAGDTRAAAALQAQLDAALPDGGAQIVTPAPEALARPKRPDEVHIDFEALRASDEASAPA